MVKLFSFAPEPHPVWSPLANEIHAAVFDRVGVEPVREHIRKWAVELNQQCVKAQQVQDDWRRKAKQLVDKAPERLRPYLNQCRSFADELARISQITHEQRSSIATALARRDEITTVNERLCPNASQLFSFHEKVEVSCDPFPADPELPLPLSHRRLAESEQWALLAAIHDYYHQPGEKINPWPLGELERRFKDRNDLEPDSEEAKVLIDGVVDGLGLPYWQLVARVDRLNESDGQIIEGLLQTLTFSKPSDPEADDGGTEAEPHVQNQGATADGKGVTPRNKWFLAQHEAEGSDTRGKPNVIKEKWWSMSDDERRVICPDAPAKVSVAAVRQGIVRARVARDGKRPKAINKPKKRHRKS
jgi:hypothetical protein